MNRERLLIITTVALIISNITSLVLAFLFASALRSRIDNSIDLQPTQAINFSDQITPDLGTQ